MKIFTLIDCFALTNRNKFDINYMCKCNLFHDRFMFSWISQYCVEGEKMAKEKKTNAYQKLVRIMLVMFVVLALVGAGSYLVDSTIAETKKQNQESAAEMNKKLIENYNNEVAQYNEMITNANKNQVSEKTPWPQAKTEGLDVIDLTGYAVEQAYSVETTRENMLMGGMLLVNRWHELPADYYNVAESRLLGVSDANIPVKDGSVRLVDDALAALADMLKAAETEAQLTNFTIQEGYRTMESQQKSYEKAESKYAKDHAGEVLRQITVNEGGVNYPGTSEYQSGFSFNVYQYKRGDAEFNAPKFHETPHSDWMVENSWKYGFVFRFPLDGYPNETVEGKSFKTGESKKLMIYRYVGKGHAAAMKQLDMCMEEYVEYLATHPHIAVYEDGVLKYEITRIPYNNEETLKVEVSKNAAEFTVSMDNYGGAIVCMIYE